MPPKRSRSASSSSTNITTTISDLWNSRLFLAPNEYSSATIGIHNCLVRCRDSDHFSKCFYQKTIIGRKTKDFINQLNELERKLKRDCQLNIERCVIIVRLRNSLENNEELFEKILKKIKEHLDESMRDDQLESFIQSDKPFTIQCLERNQNAIKREIASRMQRLQFHNHNEVKQPMNLINLQKWTQHDFDLLMIQIELVDPSNRNQYKEELKNLLNNSFFIIQHPSPPVAVLSPSKNDPTNAKINCRLLCLHDISNTKITVDSIKPIVCRLLKPNEINENDVSYQQPLMNWQTYSIVTASNISKTFFCAEMSEIIFNEMLTIPPRQQLPTGKINHSPFLYYIDFYIRVTVYISDEPEPFQHDLVIRSAPFGLITNTCQSKNLFAELFLEDLSIGKSMLKSSSTSKSISNLTTSPVPIVNLTIADITDSIRRYFIHKTGIQPKHWVMTYIGDELDDIYNKVHSFMDDRFYDILTKFFVQINYMAEHPLLIIFHDDELFLAMCDSKEIERILLEQYARDKKALCAMRFGSIHHMNDGTATKVGIRIDLVDKSSTKVQNYTFDDEKISSELGLFIIKIALCKASCFESILSNIIKYCPQSQIISKNMHIFVDLYNSKILHEICPHQDGYTSIWINFSSQDNKKSNENSTTDGNYSQISQHVQPYQTIHSNMTHPYTHQNMNSSPIVIIIQSPIQLIMSHQDISQLISNYLPQYSPLIHSDHIHQFNLNPLSQPLNTQIQSLQN